MSIVQIRGPQYDDAWFGQKTATVTIPDGRTREDATQALIEAYRRLKSDLKAVYGGKLEVIYRTRRPKRSSINVAREAAKKIEADIFEATGLTFRGTTAKVECWCERSFCVTLSWCECDQSTLDRAGMEGSSWI